MSLLDSSFLTKLSSIQPALIFFDIDGTLLNEHGNYSPELQQQLQRLSKLGVKLAIASGRPVIAAQFLFDQLPLTDAGLFCTGAEIYDPKRKQYLYRHYLDWDDISLLEEKIRDHNIYCEFYNDDFFTLGNNKDIASVHSEHLRVKPKKILFNELREKKIPITKLLLGVNWRKNKGVLESIASDFPHLDFAFAYFLARPDWLFASVVSSKANKQVGFDQLLDYHNVKAEEVIAFGDSHSDIPFIQKSGLGVAMGNATEELKKLADNVTLSANSDGVALVLKELLN